MNFGTMNNDVTLTGDAKPLLAGRYQVVRQLGSGGMWFGCMAKDIRCGDKLSMRHGEKLIVINRKRGQDHEIQETLSARLS